MQGSINACDSAMPSLGRHLAILDEQVAQCGTTLPTPPLFSRFRLLHFNVPCFFTSSFAQYPSLIHTAAKLVTTREASASGTSIRGAANRRGLDQGFAIKGTANVKELFPDRFGSVGNTGKELFADKLNNTRQRRQRAEDSFY